MAEELRANEEAMEQEQGGAPGAEQQEPEITLESLNADNAKLRAELAKNKIALDKALHNNGELTKQLRAKMTAQEQEDEAKRIEAENFKNHMAELEAFKKKAEAKERYLTMGMSPDFAKEAAEAEVKGDMDELTSIYKRYNEASLKAHQDEWLKNRPEPAASRDEDGKKEDPFIKGFNQGY